MLARLTTNANRLKWLVAGLLSLFWFAIYVTTVSPTVNFIDSGELITAAHEPGIAHAPGYPLYVLLGYVATHVPLGDIAWRLNMFSAFWGACAVGALFLLLVALSDYLLALPVARPRRPQGRERVSGKAARSGTPSAPAGRSGSKSARSAQPRSAPTVPQRPEILDARAKMWLLLAGAAGGASLLASSASFWSRTAQAKMYTLHFFFIFVLFLLALECRRAYDRNDRKAMFRWFIALSAVLGLSFTNHQMTALLVLPLALLLLLGNDFLVRLQTYVRRLPLGLLAFAIPLLLYLYMPIRSAQHPIMNWGSPDNAGDFWRQISDWQFRPFLLGDIGRNIRTNTGLVFDYAALQWSFLTVLVFAAGAVGVGLLYLVNKVIFAATTVFAFLTLLFCLSYGISEIEPYVVPLYAMFALWVGLAPVCWLIILNRRPAPREAPAELSPSARAIWVSLALIGLAALASLFLVYPRENFSQNRLAEQFVLNVFSELPQNSILITDYWDFYAPTYYEQLLKDVRPDVTMIDKSLLRYPFFTQQLRQRYPWLIQNSQDIVSTFSTEQRKWVDGDPYDNQALNNSYFGLMTSFFERNQVTRPAFLLTLEQCIPNVVQSCEANQIAPTWHRQPYGLVTRLLPTAPSATDVPPEPDFKLDGILTSPVYFDDAARTNTSLYVQAYQQLAAVYEAANQQDKASRMDQLATQVQAALSSR